MAGRSLRGTAATDQLEILKRRRTAAGSCRSSQYQFTESTTMWGEVGASESVDATAMYAMSDGGLFAAPRRPVEGSDDEEEEVDDDGLEEFDEDELDADLDEDLDDDEDEDDDDDLDDDEDDFDDDEDDFDDDLDEDDDDLDEDEEEED